MKDSKVTAAEASDDDDYDSDDLKLIFNEINNDKNGLSSTQGRDDKNGKHSRKSSKAVSSVVSQSSKN